jgi:NADP-dependent 3-hydroxy acid dehydrogenase YdfG
LGRRPDTRISELFDDPREKAIETSVERLNLRDAYRLAHFMREVDDRVEEILIVVNNALHNGSHADEVGCGRHLY